MIEYIFHLMIFHGIPAFLLICMAFVPVWAGGQAMKCYDQGNLGRAIWAITIATWLNVGALVFVYFIGRYNWGFDTILMLLD